MRDVIGLIATDLGVMPEWVSSVIINAPNNYKRITIPKNSGGTRTIYQPAIECKMVQRWFLNNLFKLLPVSEIATAFEPGTSIIKNAAAHRASLYSVRIDFANFFPSIKFSDLQEVLRRNETSAPAWMARNGTLHALKQVCFLTDESLPIGFPTSPRIANVVMWQLDKALLALVTGDSAKFGRAALTRYADDIVFSSNRKSACSAFVDEVRKMLNACETPKLSLNLKKTKLMNRLGGSTLITGLRIKPNGEIGIHADYRDEIRLLLSLYSKGRLQPDEFRTLQGHLAFVRHVDPTLYTRLSYRHHKHMAMLQRGSTVDGKLAA
jgi:RNA-directed DNA polymerase